jgi:hypothetical protein
VTEYFAIVHSTHSAGSLMEEMIRESRALHQLELWALNLYHAETPKLLTLQRITAVHGERQLSLATHIQQLQQPDNLSQARARQRPKSHASTQRSCTHSLPQQDKHIAHAAVSILPCKSTCSTTAPKQTMRAASALNTTYTQPLIPITGPHTRHRLSPHMQLAVVFNDTLDISSSKTIICVTRGIASILL